MKEMAAIKVTLPGRRRRMARCDQLMGEDFWRYGVAETHVYRNSGALFV